ncbi:hypothetical protein SAMN04488102_102174 [Alkalibacterium subtropicum]|uniref:Uncharacterized protein n=2 Tax=Alkalibacterium TaxID=99906 RepID=A0A1H7TV14_9LACT|nr:MULTISPECIES: hypothetical protein [Alkalibacterium]GEK90158.1 hypothetical protein APU01nite_21970 [Alkalibacterium putridalgicola]SEL88286.1 hypothetical protein SAMN04488100_11422 [Alkalibacterium putridalgicola]SFC00650.1 hypothetical protein SAMN04488102_102174 [Alkalibacterium subtropicum]
MLSIKQKNIVTAGYFILLVASLGFYSIYLNDNNESSSLFLWVALIGAGILGWKNTKFQGRKQLELICLELLCIANFLIFSFWDNEYGLNYFISGIIGAVMVVYIRHKKLN